MPKTTRIYSIDAIQFALTKSNPPDLLVTAFGTSASTGWSDIRLDPLEKILSPDGILDLALVGVPPQDISLPMLTPVTAHHVWKDASKVIGVKIHARSNDLTRLLLEDRQSAFAAAALGQDDTHTTGIQGEIHGPNGGVFKTMAIGEENVTTLVLGEEHWPTTFSWGEEGQPPPPTTRPASEENVTHHIGEGVTFHHGEHPASLPMIEDPPTSWAAEHLPPWHDPRGPIETGGVNAFGRR